MEDAHGREIALFRYALIRQAVDDELSPTERGRLVRGLAAREHFGRTDTRGCGWAAPRWTGGSARIAMAGSTRSSRRRVPRRPLTATEILDLAGRLKREQPARAAKQISGIIAAAGMKHVGHGDVVVMVQRKGLGGSVYLRAPGVIGGSRPDLGGS